MDDEVNIFLLILMIILLYMLMVSSIWIISDVVKYHINISMVTPSLKQLVAPLVKYYKALEQGLTSDDNVSFIKTYYKDYDETKVKPLETKVEKIQELTGQTEVLDKKIQEYKSALT